MNPNIMDKEPFVRWDVLADEQPPFDFLTLLQKSQFNPSLIRTFAERKRAQNLLVAELNRLLEPSGDFVRLAITNIETRRITDRVVEDWKPVLANAIGEWARQRTLTAVLDSPARSRSEPRPGGDASGSGSGSASAGGRIETTQEELAAYEEIRRLLGPARPIAYEDTVTYFKIHLAERYTWVMCRLYLGRKRPSVWVPLPWDQVQAISPALMLNTPQEGWTCITLNASGEIEQLGDVLRAAWDAQKAIRTRRAENADGDVATSDGSAAVAEPATAGGNGHADAAELSAEPHCEEYR